MDTGEYFLSKKTSELKSLKQKMIKQEEKVKEKLKKSE